MPQPDEDKAFEANLKRVWPAPTAEELRARMPIMVEAWRIVAARVAAENFNLAVYGWTPRQWAREVIRG